MELNWIVKFTAININETYFDQVWDLVENKILLDSIGSYRSFGQSKEEFLNELPKIFKKSENRESIKAKGEYFGCTFSYVLEVLKEIKNDLEKIKVEFEFCAEASGLIDDWVYYDSKSDYFDINFDDNF